jgi:hypothetical protein
MKVLSLLILALRLQHYRRAARQIHPLNPDVGLVLRRRARLEDQWRAAWR